jgi:hypothetical protein
VSLSRLNFLFDARGFGDLVLLAGDGTTVLDKYVARTGSISKGDALINPLPIDIYVIPEKTLPTNEAGMWIGDASQGWKARLWRQQPNGTRIATHLLIHPDGGMPGTLGCIGIQGSNAISLRHELDKLINMQGYIPMTVGKK